MNYEKKQSLMKQGLVYNIQKFSIHDGPGIRTSVFLKGCPLDCWWCHNPESKSPMIELLYNKTRCIDCLDCIKGCPENALSVTEGSVYLNKTDCRLCLSCQKLCPTSALEAAGKYMSVEQVVRDVEKDRIFYEESGGGVTITGGEPLMQPEFTYELLKECTFGGIHTAVDTSGFASWDVLREIAEYTELFLFDIKHMDESQHIKYTGVSNHIILENLKKLVEANKKINIRYPMIPGINDASENIIKMSWYLKELNITAVNLLPYHNIGIDKYTRLFEQYRLRDILPPTDEHIKRAESIFNQYNISVKIGG
ncbi:MAG: glycyl-radical enzyme activating protein [Bacillota bacterium]